MDAQPRNRPLHPPPLAVLFFSFLRLGATAFGGPAMIVHIRRLAVDRRGWLTDAQFRPGVALCQMIPGATAMQTAAYVGLRLRGMAGAAAAFIGFGLPAFLLMLLFSALYARSQQLTAFAAAFSGLRAVVVAIVAAAALSFGKSTLRTWRHAFITGASAALLLLEVNPLLTLALAGCLGGLLLESAPNASAPSALPDVRWRPRPLLGVVLVALAGLLLLRLDWPPLAALARVMLKIDLCAFGGGFTTLPLMFHDVVETHAWMTAPQFMDGIVLGQITPGPIVITATFVGWSLHGAAGALIATISIFLPSFLLVVGIAPWFERIRASALCSKVLTGILCSFVGLLLATALQLAANVAWDWPRAWIAAAAFSALLLKVDIVWVVLAGAAIGAARAY